jgi:hypothetical protein
VHDAFSNVQQKTGSIAGEATGEDKARPFHFAAPRSGAIPANLDANTMDSISSPVWGEIADEGVSGATAGHSQEIAAVPTVARSGARTSLSPAMFSGWSQPSIPASSPPAD